MTHDSGRRLVRRLRRMMPRNIVSSAKPTRMPAARIARIRSPGASLQSATAKCTTTPSTNSTKGTRRAPDMGSRSGSLKTQSHRAQTRKAMRTRVPPISGITAVRKAFAPLSNQSS